MLYRFLKPGLLIQITRSCYLYDKEDFEKGFSDYCELYPKSLLDKDTIMIIQSNEKFILSFFVLNGKLQNNNLYWFYVYETVMANPWFKVLYDI